MKFILIILVACWLSLTLLGGCQQQCSCVSAETPSPVRDTVNPTSIIGIGFIPRFIQANPVNPKFEVFFNTRNDTTRLVYVARSNELVQVNIMDSTDIRRTRFTFFTAKNNCYLNLFGDTVVALDLGKNLIFTTTLTGIGFGPIKQENFSYDVPKGLPLLSFNEDFHTVYRAPYLFTQYAKHGTKNFIDKNSTLRINTQTGDVDHILPWPKCYQTCEMRGERSSKIISNNKIYYLYTYFDQVESYSFDGKKLNSFDIPGSRVLVPFEKEKEQDLAYNRKYHTTQERNTRLLPSVDNGLVVLQTLPKPKVTDSTACRFIFFDANDHFVRSAVLHEKDLIFSKSFPFKNGFAVPSPDFDNLYYYEVKH